MITFLVYSSISLLYIYLHTTNVLLSLLFILQNYHFIPLFHFISYVYSWVGIKIVKTENAYLSICEHTVHFLNQEETPSTI